MTLSRRNFIHAAGGAAVTSLAGGTWAQSGAGGLKISHQFPGGTLTEGDFRDRLCRRFAVEVEKRTAGALKASVYPGSSLMKTNAQFSAVRKGALDMSLFPLSYAGGEVAETNIGLMPALVPSYEQGARWKNAEVGKLLSKMLDDKGVIIVSWVWQAGGVASRTRPLLTPDDAKGLKVRGGSRAICKETGGLDNDVDAVAFPVNFGRVFLCQYFDCFAIHLNTVGDSFDGAFVLSECAVPF